MKFKFSKEKIILLFILVLAAAFRLYNVNWDQGHHLHPDERAVVMAVTQLKSPSSLEGFLSPESTWNPHFFAYGSFPIYLLRVTGSAFSVINPLFGQYDSINLVGRVISAFADLASIILIFKLGKKLSGYITGLIASFFYAISVLPIQLSHFYAVDTLLTCFILLTLYSLLSFYEKPSLRRAVIIGISFGLALATKISALVLLASIGTALITDFALIFLQKPHRPKFWFPHFPKFIKNLISYALIITFTTSFTFFILEPYALIDFKNFWQQTLQQSTLTSNPFYFPYTLQYVGKIPYFYELKNVFLWGMGPALAVLSFAGTIYFIFLIFRKEKNSQFAKEFIIFVFFIIYFFIVGKFAVGFMRYMLPLYPLFCLFAAILIYRIIRMIKSSSLLVAISYLLFAICLSWPVAFIHTYSQNNTRVDATAWITQHIPPGKMLAVEHWDDGLPLTGYENYRILTLTLYDPDTDQKWDLINAQLKQSDYIIVASNRLSTPLQKLTDCAHLPSYRCYPRTSDYYKELFSGKLGFRKVAEFTNYPLMPIVNIKINDQASDENFTVFDHPKIMIFQKTLPHSTM